jgi:NAD(P)H-flavin reductase
MHQTFTREPPADWSGFARSVDADMLSHVGPAPSQRPRIFVCGPTAFVERAVDLLVALGHDTAQVSRTDLLRLLRLRNTQPR